MTAPVVADLDVEDPAWSRIVATAEGTSSFHHPTLVRAAASSTGCRAVALGARRGTELVGGLVAIATPHGVILPRSLAAYNGPLIAPIPDAHPRVRYHHESAIAGALLDELVRRHPDASLRLRPGTFDVRGVVAAGWTSTMSFTYVLDVRDLELAWHRMSPNRRRLVRRAEQRGIRVREVTVATPAVIDRVSDLHVEQQASYGAAVDLDPDGWRSALPMLLDSGVARLFVADDADRIAAFVVVTASTPSAAVLASGADRSRLDDGVAALLRWEAFRVLAADGVDALDLNGARTGPHGRFKSSFGGELVERWELRSPRPAPRWRTIPRRAARQVRDDIRTIRESRR